MVSWLQKIVLLFKDRQLRNKILFIMAVLVVFRLAANIPVPGIDIETLRRFFFRNQFMGLLNLFTGGALSNFSIVMLGLGPFITATVVLQLLTLIFPQLERIYKEEGTEGRQKFNQWARMLTVPMAALQGYGMLALLQRQGAIGSFTPLMTLTSVTTITAGALFLMWLGELISEKGIGNGVSLLIFAGILARSPTEVRELVFTSSASQLPSILFFFAISLAIIAGVVLVNEARRNIPVSYAKRVRGNRIYGGSSTYLPVTVNPAGVMPIIFALSLLLLPSMVTNFLAAGGNQMLATMAKSLTNFLQNAWVHGLLFFVLVFGFTYFYTAVTFDPKTIANNLQKMGGFVPGVRPGPNTAQFLHKILYRILFMGGLFLGAIAVLPSIVQGLTGVLAFRFLIGGTAILIVVSVVLDTWRQIKAQMEMREYEQF